MLQSNLNINRLFRYKYAAKLARGTFSVLIAAYDLFSQKANKQQQPQLVAIKIMNKEHNRIGIQVRLTSVKNARNSRFFGARTETVSFCRNNCPHQTIMHVVSFILRLFVR